ncbi:unnamed protein product [Linum tenue]|uniref:Uncharacterized protein n=1 Tax=Linum tenue TaxID=586396 RepID=A0AAV0P4U4_9ROSI|nr:unnamed protein product [Linum tenue]
MSRRGLAITFLWFLGFHSPLAFTLTSNTTHILQDVVKDIAKKQNWDWEGIQVSQLVASKFRLGTSRRYEFRIRLGKSYLLFKFPDEEVDSWSTSKFDRRTAGDDESDDGGLRDLVKEVGSVPPLLRTLKLEGPFVLSVAGVGQLSLSLPLNTSYNNLKHVVVGEGMIVEVTGAREVSLFHGSDLGFAGNESESISRKNKERNGFRDFFYSLCKPLVPIRILGYASLRAYKTRNPVESINTVFMSKNMIELLPDKCYSRNVQKTTKKACPIQSLDSRIAKLENVFSMYLGDRAQNGWLWGFMRATVKASSIFRFQLELEKTPEKNKTRQVEWRTRPLVERLWFDVTARIEDEKLKPIIVKKVRPFVAVDTASWSNLMSNLSFTKFPSILVPPEALTLDVKW